MCCKMKLNLTADSLKEKLKCYLVHVILQLWQTREGQTDNCALVQAKNMEFISQGNSQLWVPVSSLFFHCFLKPEPELSR